MRKKARRKPRPEILWRTIRVLRTDVHLHLGVGERRGLPPRREASAYLVLEGKTEPLQEVTDVRVQAQPDDDAESGPARPYGVGSILSIQPIIQAVVGVPTPCFDRLVTLASAGLLRYCWIAFPEPKRGHARILSISFQTNEEE